MNQLERIHDIFTNLTADTLGLLDQFYAPDVHFADALASHHGLDELKKYYRRMYENLISIDFEFKDAVSDPPQHVVTWTMKLRTHSLKGGELIQLEGSSLIRFNDNDLVSYHRDYFDMGEFVYENIPGLGWVIQKIKAKMTSH